MLTYKNYVAKIELDTEAGVFHGRVLGIKDLITFEGETPEEFEREFRKSVDAYLDFCGSNKYQPNLPDSNQGKKIPLAVQKLIDDPNFPDNLVSEVQTSLKDVDPYTISCLVKALGELIVSLESIKPYLKDEPDSICKVVGKLNSLLLPKEEETLSQKVAQLNSIINAKADSISDSPSSRKLGYPNIDQEKFDNLENGVLTEERIGDKH